MSDSIFHPRRRFSQFLSLWCIGWMMVPLHLPMRSLANPDGGTVAGGSVSISGGPGQVTVNQSSNRAVVNWNGFSIEKGETTTFVQPSAKSSILNRVTGGSVSRLDGNLNANGQVYLVNKNGVLVGKTGRVNTAGFTASTHDVSNSEFMQGGDLNFRGNSSASVINHGKIRATDGDVTLIARQVDNHGKISARKGSVNLVGGTEVLVKPSGTEGQRVFIKSTSGSGSVLNTGSIRAAAAELRAAGGNEYALAVNNSGVIRATAVDKRGGRIVLRAERGTTASGNVQNSGRLIASSNAPGKRGGSVVVTGENVRLTSTSVIDAGSFGPGGDGGTVNIGGGYQGKDAAISNATTTVVEAGSVISVDGTSGGKGGTAVIWSDKRTDFLGNITARDGGFVEVSSKGLLNFAGMVDTGGGLLLLDPASITISDGLSTSATPTVSTVDSVLNVGTLQNLLAVGNVTLQATNFIVVAATVNAPFNNSLMLQTAALHLNAPINLGTGKVMGSPALRTVYINAAGLIQNGVDAVASGGTVYLGTGTFAQNNITIVNKALTINGTGAATTIIDGGNTGRPFLINAGEGNLLTFNGLAITKGLGTEGGAISITSGNFKLTNARLFQNTGNRGGGIYTRSSGTLALDKVTFELNSAEGGGGLYVAVGAGPVSIANSNFTTNTVSNIGGALANKSSGTISITGTTIYDNRAYKGGGINNEEGTIIITKSTLQGNKALNTNGGGVTSDFGVLRITNSILDGNTAAGTGGGVDSWVSTVTISNSTLRNNTAVQGGGAIRSRNSSNIIITGTLLEGNSTGTNGNGGGINFDTGTLAITDSILRNHTARYGGAIFGTGDGTVTMTRSTLDNNSARAHGGGIFYGNSGTGKFTIINSTLSRNTAPGGGFAGGDGGGICNLGTMEVIVSTLSGNRATGTRGGGIANVGGTLTITDSTLQDNSAAVFGGGLSNYNGTVTITGSTFLGNIASNEGGGIHIDSRTGTNVSITNSTFTKNSAGSGSAILIQTGSLSITSCTIFDNTTPDPMYGTTLEIRQASCSVHNSIVAGNNTYQDYDIWNPGGLTSTYSLFGTNNGIGHAITGTNVTTNVTAAALKLGPLGWYGGPTQTFTLLTGSPALNTGNPTYANAGSPLNVDQRGRGRDALSFAGPAPDIGAFEAHTNGGAYVVTNTADDGSGGSFRLGFDGTNLAEKPTSITFNIPTTDGGYNTTNPGKWTILNTGGVYQLNNRSLSIDATTQPGYVQGSANPLIVIDGGGTRQIMVSLQSAGDVVSISGLGFYRGKSAAGGAIFANGELHVSESAFYFNNASSGGAIYSTGGGDISVTNSVFYRNIAAGGGGGAINIFSLTKLTVKDSTLLENQTNSSGGAISLGTDGTAIIENSTFSGNTAPDFGGGIYSSAGSSVLNVTNSTFSGNTSNGGSGSAIDTMGTTEIKSSTFSGNSGSAVVGVGGTLSIGSTIIANSGGGVDIYYTGAAYTDLGYNIIENAGFQAPSFNGPGTVTGVDPGLSSLGWYGGPTQTFGLLSGSIALDKIPDTAFVAGTTDQRGVTRGQSLAGNGYADIGAFESRTAYTVTSTADYDPAVVTHMDGTLRLGLAINAAGLDEGLRTINFAIATTDKGYDPLTGQWTITAAPRATPTPNTSAFSITNPVVIDGTTQPVAATPADPRIVVDGNKLGTVFVIDPGASTDIVSITGLGITNGNGRDYSGGIFIFGGGVVVESGDVSLSQSMIYNNSAAWSGGGVYIDNGAKLTLDTSTVTGNSSLGSGGGIYNVGTLIITNSTLTNNTSQGYGGAIYSSNSLNISDSVIAFNQTTTGSGGGIETRGTAILDNTTLRSNVAGNSGGGLNTTGGRTTVTNSTIVSNAAYGNGGGISISGGTVFELTGTTVASNGAGIHGGGIVIDSGSLTITNSTISSNSALSYGGGVSTGMLPTVTIDNSVLAANIAQSGGGIFNNGVMDITASTLAGNNASGVGGGIYNWRGGLNFDGSVIAGNSSLYGGGIYNDFGTSTAITNSIIKGNTGYSGGGGIFSLYSPLVMTDSTISYNVNYSIAGSGGGLYYVSISPNTATISRSLFEGNHSVGVAGGIYMETDSTLQLTNSTIRANTAYAGGGMYLKGLATILGSTISGNVAASNGGGLSQAGGTLNITTSTFAGNVATAGAGLYLSSGTFTLNNSTISANRATNLTATGGGGLHSRANLQIGNTILAGNIGYDWVMPAGTFIDNGYNLVGSYSLSVPVTLATSTQTIVGLPGLAPLGNYGGPTQTMALMPGSLAIGRAGPTLAGTRDQRGVLRSDGAPDIGAFESRGFVYAITNGNNQSAVFGTVFAQPLVVTMRSLDPGLTNLSGFGNTITLSLPAAGAISTGVLTQNILFNGLTNTAAFNLTAAGTVGTYNVNVTNSTTPLFFTLTNSGIPVTILVDPGQGKTLTKSLLPPPFDTTAFNATHGRNNEPEDYYLYELPGARFTMGYEGKFPLPASLLHINSGDIIPDQAR